MDSWQRFICNLLFFGNVIFAFAQQPDFPASNPSPELMIDGFSYPDFNDGSRYASFALRYPLTRTTEFGVFGHHYRNIIAERFRIPVQIKQYVNEELFLISGYEQEWNLRSPNGERLHNEPLKSFFYGMGYDVKPGLSMEAIMQNPINDPGFSPLGLEGASSIFKLNTRFKF